MELVENASQLTKMLGCDGDEGVVVAVFPEVIDEVVTQEISYLDKKGDHCHAVISQCGPWGQRCLDIQSPNDEPIKWWRVKEAAAIEKLNLIPVRWEGPISEIPERYFVEGYVLAIRFWAHGPFFFPKEKPVVKSEEAEAQQMEDALKAVDLVAGA